MSGAKGATNYCKNHGGGRCCTHDGCSNGARDLTNFCVKHGGGKRCTHDGCNKGAEGTTNLMDAVAPHASYANRTLCWGCFAALHPDLARSKVRKEHLVLSELERRCADIFEQCGRATWDCPVEGGCSMKRPDLALDFGTHVAVIEVDELQHDEASCWDEDTRLAVIAADFQKPVAVIRLRVDTPVPCFRRKRMCNGEPTWAAIEAPFGLLMSRAEVALRELAQQEPCANGDCVVQFKLTA